MAVRANGPVMCVILAARHTRALDLTILDTGGNERPARTFMGGGNNLPY